MALAVLFSVTRGGSSHEQGSHDLTFIAFRSASGSTGRKRRLTRPAACLAYAHSEGATCEDLIGDISLRWSPPSGHIPVHSQLPQNHGTSQRQAEFGECTTSTIRSSARMQTHICLLSCGVCWSGLSWQVISDCEHIAMLSRHHMEQVQHIACRGR